MGLKIDAGVPMPPHPKYKFGEMQEVVNKLSVGDSVFIPCDNPVSKTSMMHKCALRAHIKITTRRTVESNLSGVRVWRVE